MEVTALVVIVKLALLLPPGTVTDAGTRATDVLLLESDTTTPAAGAGPVSVTVPVEGFPPTTVAGFLEMEDRAVRFTVSVLELVAPPKTAEIVTEVELVTGLVEIGKLALALPPETVTVAGTDAAAPLLLDNETTIPPAGAGPLSVIVPVEGFPPVTVEGLRDRDDRAGRFTVKVADLVAPP